jgi:cell division protein FtsA
MEARIYAGLDIGTTKITVIVAELDENGESLRVIGVGSAASDGLKRGVVVNLEKTVRSIQHALEEAERVSGRSIKSVWAGIAGDHIRGITSRGVIAVSRKDAEIRPNDVARVIEAAKAVAIPADREILHVLPQEFIVDDQEGIRDPIGMSGVRLEAEAHIITGAAAACRNVIRAAERAGVHVEELVLEPLASANAVLAPDEKDLGVALLDIGGGTTDVAVISLGGIVTSSSLRTAGDEIDEALISHVKSEYSLLLGERSAEDIKVAVGSVFPLREELTTRLRGHDLVTGLPKTVQVGSVEVRRAIEGPVLQIIELVRATLDVCPPELAGDILDRGITLTGGGALLRGLDERMRHELGVPVRVAEDPLRAVARGAGRCVDEFATLERVLVGDHRL